LIELDLLDAILPCFRSVHQPLMVHLSYRAMADDDNPCPALYQSDDLFVDLWAVLFEPETTVDLSLQINDSGDYSERFVSKTALERNERNWHETGHTSSIAMASLLKEADLNPRLKELVPFG
jgi:hypothetical protein